MDLVDLLHLIPGAAWLVPYVLAASGLAAWVVAVFPPPASPTWLVTVWAVLNRLGANVRHARNREQGDDPLTPGVGPRPPDAGG